MESIATTDARQKFRTDRSTAGRLGNFAQREKWPQWIGPIAVPLPLHFHKSDVTNHGAEAALLLRLSPSEGSLQSPHLVRRVLLNSNEFTQECSESCGLSCPSTRHQSLYRRFGTSTRAIACRSAYSMRACLSSSKISANSGRSGITRALAHRANMRSSIRLLIDRTFTSDSGPGKQAEI
jgi:hypothetical protein